MPKRKPTAAEHEQWKLDVQKVDIEADRADLIAQMDSESGIREAIDRLKAYRESRSI